MPKKNRSALRAGLLMLGSIVLILCVVIGIKGLSWLRDPAVNYHVVFDLRTNIGGLRIGDEVRIGGFKVGEVKRIFLHEDADPKHDPYYLVVEFTVPRKYSIRKDASIRIDGTLTGTSWLNFEALGRGNVLATNDYLVGKSSTTNELLASIGGLGAEIKPVLANVNTTITDVQTKTVPLVNQTLDKFGQTADSFKKTGDNATALTADMRETYKPVVIAEYKKVTEKAVEMMEAIRALFGDTTVDFRTTVANLRKSTDSVREKLPGILDKVDGALTKVDAAVDKVNKAMVEVHAAVVNAKDLTAGAKSVVVGNRSKLDSMIASLKTTGDNLKAATAEIRRSPWRLLYKPAPNEMANLNLYDAARQFAEGANELNDTAGALRDAVKNNQTSPEELKKLMEKVDQSFANFKQVEDKLWSNVKE